MSRKRSLIIPGVDKTLLVRDATKVMPDLTRRRFITGGASLGALTLLTGFDVVDSSSAEETLDELYALPQVKQVTRHICVEGWSAIGSWTGTPMREFLKIIGADTRAKYVWFQCADKDGYNSPLDMASALHPQTQMTFKFADEILPRAYGFPMKIRVPTKLGFKNPKYVISMEVTNDYKGGYWEDQGYNSFSAT